MPAIRAHQQDTGADNFVEITWPPEAQVGDRAFCLVFGGNQVNYFYPNSPTFDTWKVLAHETGQEAQGQVMTLLMTQDVIDTGFYQLGFDGSDPFRVVTIIAEGNCGYQLPISERDGSVGVTFPAYDQPVGVPALTDELLIYFTGARNATDDPTSAIGTLLESYSGTHTMGCWAYEVPGAQTVANTLGIPERSGHYRAVLRLFDWVEGPWRTDADTKAVGVDSHSSYELWDGEHLRNNTWLSGYTDDAVGRDVILGNSWQGGGGSTQFIVDVHPAFGGLWGLQGNVTGDTSMVWYQTWVAVQRKAPEFPVDKTAYPGDAPDDAVDVEWEPSTTAESYQLDLNAGVISSSFVPSFGPDPDTGPDTVGFAYRDLVSTTHDGYTPSIFESRDAVRSAVKATDHAFTIFGGATRYPGHSFDLGPGEVGTYVAGTIVDAVTMLGDTSQALATWATGNPALQYEVLGSLLAIIRPRYRFLFDPLVSSPFDPPRRIYPSRTDDLGTGIGRVWPPPDTQQSGRRAGPSAVI